ncbi:hypothetical protein C4K05_2130 [Pseudomonas chlororaphis subsp. aureofaciens]|jgi:hypothetical protein|nr:hypothetical protein C4K05_2130 [Pseudomonas chlororaphis subsp. aureofaciens]
MAMSHSVRLRHVPLSHHLPVTWLPLTLIACDISWDRTHLLRHLSLFALEWSNHHDM